VALDELKSRPVKPGQASFFFFDHHFQYNAVKVLQGEYYVSHEDLVIMTVLGSCIAACLWDSRMRVGGMNHFMLPGGFVGCVGEIRLLRHGAVDQRDAQARCAP
jgi:chemotaxis protein CheD